jgi:hypothetical protein
MKAVKKYIKEMIEMQSDPKANLPHVNRRRSNVERYRTPSAETTKNNEYLENPVFSTSSCHNGKIRPQQRWCSIYRKAEKS